MFVASLLLRLTMRMRALLSTIHGLNEHRVLPFTRTDCTIIAAVSALLSAATPSAPCSFAIDWAWMCVAWFVFNMFMLDRAFMASKLRWNFDLVRTRAAATTTVGAAMTPLGPLTLAIDWARSLAAWLGICCAMCMAAWLSIKLCFLSDDIVSSLGAASTKVVTWICNLRIACAVFTPVSNAWNGASRLLADGKIVLIRRWAVLALCAAMLGRGLLHPFAVLLDDVMFSVRAFSVTFAEIGPSTRGRNRARFWGVFVGRRATRHNFHVAFIFAFFATMLGNLCHNEVTSLSSLGVWHASSRGMLTCL